MMTIYKKPGWFFYPGWVALTTLSIPVAFAITWIIISQVVKVMGGTVMINGRSRIAEDWLAGYIFVPALGLATGEGTTGPLDIWYFGVLPAITTSAALRLLMNRAPPPEPQGA